MGGLELMALKKTPQAVYGGSMPVAVGQDNTKQLVRIEEPKPRDVTLFLGAEGRMPRTVWTIEYGSGNAFDQITLEARMPRAVHVVASRVSVKASVGSAYALESGRVAASMGFGRPTLQPTRTETLRLSPSLTYLHEVPAFTAQVEVRHNGTPSRLTMRPAYFYPAGTLTNVSYEASSSEYATPRPFPAHVANTLVMTNTWAGGDPSAEDIDYEITFWTLR